MVTPQIVQCHTGLTHHFFIFDIRALWRSGLSARALKGLTHTHTFEPLQFGIEYSAVTLCGCEVTVGHTSQTQWCIIIYAHLRPCRRGDIISRCNCASTDVPVMSPRFRWPRIRWWWQAFYGTRQVISHQWTPASNMLNHWRSSVEICQWNLKAQCYAADMLCGRRALEACTGTELHPSLTVPADFVSVLTRPCLVLLTSPPIPTELPFHLPSVPAKICFHSRFCSSQLTVYGIKCNEKSRLS